MTLQWQDRRRKFNHDWLKNGYILKLSEWLNLLDDKIENPVLESQFVDTVLPAWKQHRDEALALPVDFEKNMSPKILFTLLPLSNCDDETKQWLGDLVHNLWLARYSIMELTSSAIQCACDADSAYQKLGEALTRCSNTKDIHLLRPHRGLFADLFKKCRLLAEAIEKLPNEVAV